MIIRHHRVDGASGPSANRDADVEEPYAAPGIAQHDRIAELADVAMQALLGTVAGHHWCFCAPCASKGVVSGAVYRDIRRALPGAAIPEGAQSAWYRERRGAVNRWSGGVRCVALVVVR